MDEPACTVKQIRIHHDDYYLRYTLEFAGHEDVWVTMDFTDLASKRSFHRRTMECFYQFIDPPSRVQLNGLLADAEHVYPKDFPALVPPVLRRVK